MSIENDSSRTSPHPWYLETNKGVLSPDSPEVKSFAKQGLVSEDVAVSGLTIRLTVKNKQMKPLQDVRLFELFSNLAEVFEINPTKKDAVKSVTRELEQNADQYSHSKMTNASLTVLDSVPGMMGLVVSNIVPSEKVDKVRQDDDLFETTGDSELDALIARIKTSGRGLKLTHNLTEGRHGRFEYDDYTQEGVVQRKMAAYAIFSLEAESLENGDTTLAA